MSPGAVPVMGRVVHCRRAKFDLYIGRAYGGFTESVWENPFHIGKDGSRDEVIDKYEARIRADSQLMDLIPSLTGLTLGCWCHPLPCHGDMLLKLVREYWEQKLGCRFQITRSGFYVPVIQLPLALEH
jgi:hypothetical protein